MTDEESERLAWETAMLAQIERLKAELRQYREALEGCAIVPVEPTPAMLSAAQTAWNADNLKRTSTLWAAMVEAGRKQ